MVQAKDISFVERKSLPTVCLLNTTFGIKYNSNSQQFDTQNYEIELNGFIQILAGGTYFLFEFISDYYEMDFTKFRAKFNKKLRRKINEEGYIKSIDGSKEQLSIRDLAFFANKERKFGREVEMGRERGNWIKTICYNVSITTSQTDVIIDFVNTIIDIEELRFQDIIMLKLLKQVGDRSYAIYKIFKSVDVREKQDLFLGLNVFADGFFGKNDDYSQDVDRLELDIIEAVEGGCNKRELRSNNLKYRLIHPKSSHNNCFFKCIQPYVPCIRERISLSACNTIRQQFRVKSNDKIDIQAALKIFQHYREDTSGLKIWTSNTLIGEVEGNPTLHLSLEDEHYSILCVKLYQHCPDCDRNFISKHKCDTNRKVFKQIKKGKNRFVIKDYKQDKLNFDKQESGVVIVHYDIETHTRKRAGSVLIHIPYIVGFVDNIDNQFHYFTGEDCMEQFIRQLFTYKSATKVYINAFNGSKFDHYEFIKKMNKLNKEQTNDDFKLNQLMLNNGSILKATVGNIECFDISKHLTGSLKQNLKELNCTVQKGEFDYELGDDWKNMSENSQDQCIQYLQGDVMGLKELSERLNEECFETFKVNLYKYLSTSQLTYSIWVNRFYTQKNEPIYLQNAEQEKFFRESIYGGRTYKYKNSFISKQRDDYMKGDMSFDDIDDYLIDADVNSLYPAAMMNPYPVGVPRKLKQNTLKYFNQLVVKENKCPKFGIYRVQYTTNKHLIDGILPRREEGRLKWDLKDSEGVFNSVDIDNALRQGYQVKFLDGYYWEKTEMVFDEYIQFLYDFKKKATKGSVRYTLAKLMMNGLYGKTIQRPILDESIIIHKKEEFISLHIKYGGVEMSLQSDGSYYVKYQNEAKLEKKITKPCYLGSFILGYSRRIMLGYLEKTNPYFNSQQLDKQLENSPYYTDTDSIQIHHRNLANLTLNKEIGGISDDLGDNCKILYGGWIAPKLYFLEYVEKKNGEEHIKYHLRGKGIPKEQLSLETFERMMKGQAIEVQVSRDFKRIHVNRNSNQKECENFTIAKLEALTKTINKTHWKGRHFIENASVPMYHISILKG